MMSKKSPQLRFEGFTDDWEERKLGEISKTTIGEFVIKTKQSDESPYPVYNGGRSYTGKYDEYNNDGPKIVISARGANAGFVNYVSGRYWAGNSCYSVSVIKEDEFSIGYLYQFIKYNQVLFTAYQQAANIPSVSKSDVEKFSIKYPTVLEQKKIESFFKQLDNTIALHQRKLDLLKEQKKGYLQKMFPKNGAKVPELRFAGFADDWEERKLGDYIIQYSEKTKQNNQYPVFTSSRNGLFFQKDYYKGNQIASEDNTGYNIVPRGYFTYRHMSDDLVFKFNINDLADYGIVSTLYPVFTTNEQLDSKYLQYQLNEGSEFRRFSLLQKQGGSRTYMYLNKLQNMILTIPKLEEQQKIGSFFKQLDDTIALHQRKLDLLKEQKKGFLQKMFV
ncbi:restriction endonuclease subunit S [Lactococcus lactis]|uniref:restriction endonuclease subunit S n=1 Tax=Lactococcus lactis TaxID=1358 RepID=UPI0025A0E198|nr:restriction endonuclease subunit S [Lactococcus lactis]MDM7645122.1 restriction endonuclease subunit S [Lactococcus lactis]